MVLTRKESKRLAESQATKFAVQNLVNSLKHSIDTGLNGLGFVSHSRFTHARYSDAKELNSIVKKELALSLLQDCDQSSGSASPLVVFK